MEVEKYEPTRIADKKREPRTLAILPPSFNEPNQSQDTEILDGLPYIERFSEMQIANAEKLVQDELSNMDNKDYLSNIPKPSFPNIDSKQFEEQVDRIKNNEPVLDLERYECNGPRKDQTNSLPIWKKEIENTKSVYSHQLNELMNLELMKKYNASQWNNYNNNLRLSNDYHDKQMEELQSKMDNVNKKRKLAQQEAEPELNRLKNEWWNLVRKNNEIELQSQILKSQIDGIKQIKAKYASMNNDNEMDQDVQDDDL